MAKGREAESDAILGFCSLYQQRYDVPCEVLRREVSFPGCSGSADALLLIGSLASQRRVLLETTQCFRGPKGEHSGAYSAYLVRQHERLEEALSHFADEECVRIEVYINLPADDPLDLLSARLGSLVGELPSTLRGHLRLARNALEEPFTVDRNLLSDPERRAVDAVILTANIPAAVTIRYRTPVSGVYGNIPGNYVGVDHEGIELAIANKLDRLEQYKCIARSADADEVYLLLVADGSSPSSFLAHHLDLWFQPQQVPSLSSELNFDAVYLAAWGPWVKSLEDLSYGLPSSTGLQYSWEIFTLRGGVG